MSCLINHRASGGRHDALAFWESGGYVLFNWKPCIPSFCRQEELQLTLTEAIKSGRLREFIAQEEARGIGPAARKELDDAIKRLVSPPWKSKGRSSRSKSPGGRKAMRDVSDVSKRLGEVPVGDMTND